MREIIERAFGGWVRPNEMIDVPAPLSGDHEDALSFARRDWRDITREDWEKHSGAITAFSPAAFRYFLGSVMCLSAQRPDQWFWPADTVLGMLDRSPLPEYWSEFFSERFMGFSEAEYEALSEWILLLSNYQSEAWNDACDRAFDTIQLLKEESRRRLKS
ncbi:hypothetical protein [Pseudoduganella violacea]|nr:hypothetical protein [Pseudoduganella violacea]